MACAMSGKRRNFIVFGRGGVQHGAGWLQWRPTHP
jgi:hypothetical protein